MSEWKNKIFNEDCLKGMKRIPDNSIDLVLCDLPYEVTQNKKDKKLNLEKLWKEWERVCKENCIYVLTSQFPFTIDLIMSKRKWFRYDIIWDKQLKTGFLNAKRMPLRKHEHILIFYKKPGTYNPQMEKGELLHSKGTKYYSKKIKNQNYGKMVHTDDNRKGSTEKYPSSILSFQKPHPSCSLHRTEKPIDLFRYLIRTYSKENDVVLDSTIGCGTTAVAAKLEKRNYVGFELDTEYYKICKERLK